MAEIIGSDLKKFLMAGVGAVVTAGEKSKEFFEELGKKGEMSAEKPKDILEELARKGEAAFQQGKVLNEELKHKVKEAYDSISTEDIQKGVEDVLHSLDGMTDDALTAIRQKLDELAERRAAAKDENCECGCEDECECDCDCECETECDCKCECETKCDGEDKPEA